MRNLRKNFFIKTFAQKKRAEPADSLKYTSANVYPNYWLYYIVTTENMQLFCPILRAFRRAKKGLAARTSPSLYRIDVISDS